jgi:GrpB-like predicted nucleotidyltransferase (UPF0157 family)
MVDGQEPSMGPIHLAEPDPAWPALFEHEAEGIRAALGPAALTIEHAGSTSVPGLAAKPTIDIVLVIADSSDEPAYIPPLQAAGYVLRIREPDWHEHRMLKGPNANINLHVFSDGCPEIDRMLLFRDWLRGHPEDRARYEAVKRELAARDWPYIQDYADAKTEVVEEIIVRASADRSAASG